MSRQNSSVGVRARGEVNRLDEGDEVVAVFFDDDCVVAFPFAAGADLAGFAGLALDEQAAFAVIDNTADYAGGDEQAGVPVGQLVQWADGFRAATAKIRLGIAPQAAIFGDDRRQFVRVDFHRAQAQGVVVAGEGVTQARHRGQCWPGGFAFLPGGEGVEHFGVHLERCGAFAADDDDLLEAVGRRLPDT